MIPAISAYSPQGHKSQLRQSRPITFGVSERRIGLAMDIFRFGQYTGLDKVPGVNNLVMAACTQMGGRSDIAKQELKKAAKVGAKVLNAASVIAGDVDAAERLKDVLK